MSMYACTCTLHDLLLVVMFTSVTCTEKLVKAGLSRVNTTVSSPSSS